MASVSNDAQDFPWGMIFICGCGHSGTTLLTAMLGAHKDIYSITEETRIFIKDGLSDSDIRRFFLENHAAKATQDGARFLCEKTPMHIHHLHRMRSVFPGASIIIPVRDPRDVALSIKTRTGDLKFGYERWLRDNAVVLREREQNTGDTFIFRYEDFMDDVQGTLVRICDHVGIPYDPAMMEYHQEKRTWFSDQTWTGAAGEHVKLRNWQVNQPIMERRGRWRDLLTADEITAIEGATKDMMTAFGYAPETNP